MTPRFHRWACATLAVAMLGLMPTHSFAQSAAQPEKPDANSTSKAQPKDEIDELAKPAPPLPAGMTGADVNDPRYKLKPGLYDAGEIAMGLKRLTSLHKPDAFELGTTDANDPRTLRMLQQLGEGDPAKMSATLKSVLAELAFANSDLAFQSKYLFQGNFYGVSIYDISNPAQTSLITTLVCPGGQGDVSVYGNLMFMSVEMPNGRVDCGTQGFPPNPPLPKGTKPTRENSMPAASKDRFRGVRIFDIADIRNPKQIAAVQTCRGSHTHTLLVDPNDKDNVYIYVSGTSFVRQNDELAGCSDGMPDKNANTALFRIDVIKVPLTHPQDAAIVNSPRVFMDPRTGALAGLNNGGSHDQRGAKPVSTNQCHDITVYPQIGLAAGACSGNGLLLDIKDPVHPRRVDAVNDPNYAYWHSASFSNDGTKAVFTDEWGGGLGARCRPNDPIKWGADAIFSIHDDKLIFDNYYKLPAAQGDSENCVAHNGSLIPVPGRDIEVQSWYQGGVSIMDFTDPKKPFEIAYFDRGPIDPKVLVLGGDWSAYWYNGNIYASEIARGLDVFELVPSKFLTQNEIDAAKTIHMNELNVQHQQRIEWPAQLVVASAYLDQLERSQALPAGKITSLRNAIATAEKSNLDATSREKLIAEASTINAGPACPPGPQSEPCHVPQGIDAKRIQSLQAILLHPAA